jgi:hypothetical protein
MGTYPIFLNRVRPYFAIFNQPATSCPQLLQSPRIFSSAEQALAGRGGAFCAAMQLRISRVVGG